jgi:hypothetical protein
LAIVLWAIFFPRPYGLCIAVLVVAPVAAIAAAWMSGGTISLNDRKGEKRPVLGTLMLLPWLALGARAVIDYQVLDWIPPLVLAVAIGGLAALAAMKADAEFRKPLWAILLLLMGLDWGWGLVIEANGLFDRTPPQILSTKVLRKWKSSGRSTTYYLNVAPTSVPGLKGDIDVGSRLYRRIDVGESVCLELHAGSLGWRWYRPAACGGGPTP